MQQQFQTTLDEFKNLALTIEEQKQLKGGNDEEGEGIISEEEIIT